MRIGLSRREPWVLLAALSGCARPDDIVQVSVGYNSICICHDGGAVECVHYKDGSMPPPSERYEQVAAGYSFACGIRSEDLGVECWGDPAVPLGDPPEGEFSAVIAGNGYQSTACALDMSGAVTCWGDPSTYVVRYATEGPDVFRQISAGLDVVVGTTPEGHLACWGEMGDLACYYNEDTHDVQFAAGGGNGSCILFDDGSVDCSLLGVPNPANRVPAGGYTAVAAGDAYVCALDEAGELGCWGENGEHQLAPPAGAWTAVSAVGPTICAIDKDRAVTCWGLVEPYEGLSNFAHIWEG